jgi:hypothetical protein
MGQSPPLAGLDAIARTPNPARTSNDTAPIDRKTTPVCDVMVQPQLAVGTK